MFTKSNKFLVEAIWTPNQDIIWIQRLTLISIGIAFLIIAAKVKLILPFSPVPITLGTFAVLTIGTTYGQRLGLLTIFGYLLIGMLGFDVFANSSAEANGLNYMLGGTGGYLIGYCFGFFVFDFCNSCGTGNGTTCGFLLDDSFGWFIHCCIIYRP